ncbi:hypothetical protein BDP27DRAFT_1547703 [Rhodocollybia butyracea]|uniref:Uncharacterized protein n=1 Tax=Rhodocollybia butyracea TaxID=206335 RepID=A0A9P5PP30_9AGAR|nr:hypothetical protein BDP27DRAFT_1547703 [Rhodocollybia butyracea]
MQSPLVGTAIFAVLYPPFAAFFVSKIIRERRYVLLIMTSFCLSKCLHFFSLSKALRQSSSIHYFCHVHHSNRPGLQALERTRVFLSVRKCFFRSVSLQLVCVIGYTSPKAVGFLFITLFMATYDTY